MYKMNTDNCCTNDEGINCLQYNTCGCILVPDKNTPLHIVLKLDSIFGRRLYSLPCFPERVYIAVTNYLNILF